MISITGGCDRCGKLMTSGIDGVLIDKKTLEVLSDFSNDIEYLIICTKCWQEHYLYSNNS